jgi:hypothetical protein
MRSGSGARHIFGVLHMSFFKTISPALILGLAVATGANAQAFGVVETGGAFGVGTGAVPVAVAPAPTAAVGIAPVTGFATGLGGLGAAGFIGLGAIVAVGAISSGGSTSSTN